MAPSNCTSLELAAMPPRPQAQVASLQSELSAARLELRSLEDALAQVKVSGAARGRVACCMARQQGGWEQTKWGPPTLV